MKAAGNPAMNMRDRGKLDHDVFLHKTLALPVEAAPAKAREIRRAHPAGGYMTIVDDWWQLLDRRVQS